MAENNPTNSENTQKKQLGKKDEANDSHSGSWVKDRMATSSVSFYLGSAAVGIARTTVGFPFEHPIDSIKTQWQAKPYMKNEFAIIKDVYHTKGMIKGFYAGSLPNYARCLLKNCYRYPLMVGLPSFYKQRLPSEIKERTSVLKMMTGFSIALVESILLCPVERLKVYFMTKPTDSVHASYASFFKSMEGHGVAKELFRGFTPLLARQGTNWVTFLQTDLFFKSQLRAHLKIAPEEEIPTRYLLPASLMVALITTCFVMPFDCVKTHMEKIDPHSSYKGAFQSIYKQGGTLGFFTGVRLRFLLYFTNALFVVNLLEKLENIAQILKK